MGRASRRKGSDPHLDEMAARAARRDLRRRRLIGLRVAQAQAREVSRRLVEARGEKFCEPVDCSQPSED